MSRESYGKMADETGMSPRKAMASAKSSSSFGVDSYPGCKAVKSPMAAMGRSAHMEDGARGIGTSVGGGKGMHGMQGAPDHGPMNDHFTRDAKA